MVPANGQALDRGPFRLDQCGDLTPLYRALKDAGYTEGAVADRVPVNSEGMPIDVALSLRGTAEETPLNTLVRLFVLARAVREETARAVLAPMELEPLLALGLLSRDAEGVRAEGALIPFQDDLFLLRDLWPEFTGRAKRHDYVLGVGLASIGVANVTVRRQGERALDLGTGTGFLAFLAARHAGHVVATDTSARALNFAALNARLNGVANVELRRGSLYEPVADDSFDLIMANPPFVISPSDDYEYRDGGMEGDSICRQAIQGAAQHLREGGFANVMFNWHHGTQDDWAERPIQWLDGSGCDAWVIRSAVEEPLGYASNWLRRDYGTDPARYEQVLNQWVTYYERLGIGFISSGVVILRRRSGGPNWIRAEDAPPGRATTSCSGQIQRIFAAQDLLHRLGDERGLLDLAFALTPDHQMEQVLHSRGGRWEVQEARIRQTQGFHFIGNTDRMVATVLAGCDGSRTLRELVAELADELHLDPEKIGAPCAAIIRKLLETGFLTAAGPQAEAT